MVPISKEGYSFLYYPGACVEKDSMIMCRSAQIIIHAQPITCTEQLGFGPPMLPEKCKQNIQAVVTLKQSFIYQESAQLRMIFTPFDYIVTVSCTNMSTVNSEYNLTVGLNNVRLPDTCKAVMTELVVFASTTTTFESH
jgi:hypothetical protein